jgi:hypothetical protein
MVAPARALALPRADVLTFYDPRFPRSRRLALALPRAARPGPVRGDPSGILSLLTPPRHATEQLLLQGVTTETVPFCLEQFARCQDDARLECRRLDRDLFAWTLAVRGRRPDVRAYPHSE